MDASCGRGRVPSVAVLPLVGLFAAASSARGLEDPAGGALAGERYRVIVSTDIGGSDPDDFQSMVHYLVYADVFDTEGLVSSPPGAGRASHIDEVIAAYEADYPNLATYSVGFALAAPAELRAMTKQGATDPAPAQGYSATGSEGSSWIVERANDSDSRPLYVLVWGSITDVAQAVHDGPGIKSKVRVYSIGSWNTAQDPNARDYLYNSHPDLWWVECDTTFRGMYMGGDQSGDLGNTSFVEQHVKDHGALGALFYAKKADIKMGDTPSVLFLLRGDPADPTREHWGGSFVTTAHGTHYWHDDPDPVLVENGKNGAKTVNKWRENYLRDWQTRMDCCTKPNSPPAAFALLSPPDGATDVSLTPTLTWEASSGATGYILSRSPGQTADTGPNPSFQMPAGSLDYETTYDWGVIAENAAGDTACDASFSFTTTAEVRDDEGSGARFSCAAGGGSPGAAALVAALAFAALGAARSSVSLSRP